MTAKEWEKYIRSLAKVSRLDIVDALAALESFCEGLKGTNDDLRGKLVACERERDEVEARCKRLDDALQHCLDHGHLAPETRRIVEEARNE